MMSILILTPFAIAMEGQQLWTAGFDKVLSDIEPRLFGNDIIAT